jgi:hypothetical protein
MVPTASNVLFDLAILPVVSLQPSQAASPENGLQQCKAAMWGDYSEILSSLNACNNLT